MAKKRFNNEFEVSAITNNATYFDYLNRVRKIATSRFIWKNTPPSWDSDFLEKILFEDGVAGIIFNEDYGNIITRVTPHGELNIYENHTKWVCYSLKNNDVKYSYTGLKDESNIKDCVVIIKNNPDNIPTFACVELFCRRLYEVERTIDVNLKQQKTPSIIICEQKQRLTMINLYQQYDGNRPFIFADKSMLGDNPIRAVDTEAPYLLDKLTAHKQSLWNELLTCLGINNVNYEKKERLIEAEANANNHFITLNLTTELSCRKRACKQINDYFGLNVDVEINRDIISVPNLKLGGDMS